MPAVTEMPVANPPAEPPPPKRASLAVRLVTILAILIPFGGVIAAPFFLWRWGFHWTDLGLLLGMYLLTALGITVGFHRLLVHRSFETYTGVKLAWAVLGSMAAQGSVFKWVPAGRLRGAVGLRRLPRRHRRPAARAPRRTAGVAGAVRPRSLRCEEGDEGDEEGDVCHAVRGEEDRR